MEYSWIFGNPGKKLKQPAPILQAGPDEITFCKISGAEALELIRRSNAGLIFVHESVPREKLRERNTCIAGMKNPRLEYIRCLNIFFEIQQKWGVHPTAIVHESVSLPEHVSIGAQAIIGRNVGIGEGSVIWPRVFVMDNTNIGKNVQIQVGANIGCDGQGFERNDKGRFEKFPQIGRVVLEDYVEIGSNSTIVRGALPGVDTVIGEGTKVGHLVDIGKNSKIGSHCLISAGTILCGSVVLGDYAWIAPGSTIRQKIIIGKGATVGLGAVVVSNVPEGVTVAGVPAKPL